MADRRPVPRPGDVSYGALGKIIWSRRFASAVPAPPSRPSVRRSGVPDQADVDFASANLLVRRRSDLPRLHGEQPGPFSGRRRSGILPANKLAKISSAGPPP